MTEPKVGLDAAMQGLSEAHTRADAGEGGDRGGGSAPGAGESAAREPDLFGLPGGETGGNSVAQREGPGRPPGARNKRTDALRSYILSLGYTHPAIVLADIASADVATLRESAPGLKAGEALNAKIKAADALMPYFEQKLPTAIELPPDAPRPAWVIEGELAAAAGVDNEAMDLGAALSQVFEENQGVSEDESVRREGEASNGEGQAVGDTDETGG